MTNLSRPTSGWAILTSYNKYNHCGYYEIVDLAQGKLIIPRQQFNKVLTSDNAIGILGICRACQTAIKYDYVDKIYCSNITTYGWATKRRFNTKVSSPLIVKQIVDSLGILSAHDFSEILTYWTLDWGHMRDHVNSLRMQARHAHIEMPFIHD